MRTHVTLETLDRIAEQHHPTVRIHELFALAASARPSDTAVTFLDKSISYSSLSARTKQLATQLQNLGVKPGTLVGICMDRCTEMVAALLAILQTGAAYLPLDPSFPADRLEFMQQDARPLVVITQSHLLEQFSFSATHVLCVDLEIPGDDVCALQEFSPVAPSGPDDIAYVLYTSGSTGRPKGVQIPHRALTNVMHALSEVVSLDRTDVVLATTTISFDISTFEIFAPLIVGAHLVIAPRRVAADGKALANAIQDYGVTVLQATPAGWNVLLEAGWEGRAGLKMLSGGEPLTWILAQRLLDRGAALWNLYGPTEATVYATAWRVQKDTKITVGRTLTNCTAYVLDEQQQLLPPGSIGELFLGGICVGAGYLNRPELTAEKFVTDPFSSDGKARLYRTGDLARVLPNGEIDVLGRADNQVKLRGYRIELEEIEAQLDSHPGISKSITKVIEVGEGDQCLVAYVVPKDVKRLDEADWRQHVLRNLPWYMVPTGFAVIESFQLTPNGKVDRKAVPPFQFGAPLQLAAEEDAHEDRLDLTVLYCWQRMLNRPDLDLDQDFFEAGGHSLLVMRMLAELNKKLDLKIPVSHLAEAPTARRFAQLLMQTKDVPARYLVPMQTEGSLPPLYLVHHLLGDVLVYRSIAGLFAPDRPVFGIQAPQDLTSGSHPITLQALASEYVGEILKHRSEGPIHLGGFSTGSIIAFEMARQLEHLGIEVGLLAFIDGGTMAAMPPMPAPVKYGKIVLRKFCKIAFKLRDELAAGPKEFVSKRVRYVLMNLHMRALQKLDAATEVTTEQAIMLAELTYQPQPYAGPALLIRFHDEAWKYGPDPLMGWTGLVEDGIEVVDLPGGHVTGMGPIGAPAMVSLLTRFLDKYEKARTSPRKAGIRSAFQHYTPRSASRDRAESTVA